MKPNFDCLRVRRVRGVISTDDILPARYKHMHTDPRALAPHVFDNLLPGFAATLRGGDLLMSDTLFGVGSSREQAVSALQAAGVRAIAAPAFGRILYRNCWNLGVPALEFDTSGLDDGDEVTLDPGAGLLLRRADSRRWQCAGTPAPLLRMLEHGGLIPMVLQLGHFDG